MTNEELHEELHSAFTELHDHLSIDARELMLYDLRASRDHKWHNKLNAPGPRIHMLIDILEN
jgi:hypothetical protein